jgi:hypothetical protein
LKVSERVISLFEGCSVGETADAESLIEKVEIQVRAKREPTMLTRIVLPDLCEAIKLERSGAKSSSPISVDDKDASKIVENDTNAVEVVEDDDDGWETVPSKKNKRRGR